MTRNTLVIGALAACVLTSSVATGDESRQKADPTQSVLATGLNVGRYSMAEFNGGLVMLDTATGNSWLLRPSADSNELSWRPITNHYSIQSQMVSAAKSSTDGRVQVEDVPGRGIIVLRGNKADVDTAISAARRVEHADAGNK